MVDERELELDDALGRIKTLKQLLRGAEAQRDDCGCKTARLLSELFIPALRYYLPRHTAAAMTFPDFCKEVWRDVSRGDRAVALLDIERELDGGVMWETEREAWDGFLRWVEKEKP